MTALKILKTDKTIEKRKAGSTWGTMEKEESNVECKVY